MNRAEIRRKEKQSKKDPTYSLKQSDINKIKNEAAKNAIDMAVALMLSIPVMVLHDKYGFGKKRLQKFTDEVFELFESYNRGYVSFDDLISTLKAETEVKVEIWEKY